MKARLLNKDYFAGEARDLSVGAVYEVVEAEPLTVKRAFRVKGFIGSYGTEGDDYELLDGDVCLSGVGQANADLIADAVETASKGYPEKDPNGLDSHTPGAKLDAGKVMASQILMQFPRALLAVAEVGTFGARKYTLGGWLEVEGGRERYADAGMRHKLKRAAGEEVDVDSGLLHEAHEAWNVLAALELQLRNK